MAEPHWLQDLHSKILVRNEKEFERCAYIFAEQSQLFGKVVLYEAQRRSLKHKLSLIEHEVGDSMSKEDYLQSISYVRKGFTGLQSDLLDASDDSLVDLNRTVHDQKKAIAHLTEEATLAKQEYQGALEQVSVLRAELALLKEAKDTQPRPAAAEGGASAAMVPVGPVGTPGGGSSKSSKST